MWVCVCVCVCLCMWVSVFVMMSHVDKAWICSAEEFLELYGKVDAVVRNCLLRWSGHLFEVPSKHLFDQCFCFKHISHFYAPIGAFFRWWSLCFKFEFRIFLDIWNFLHLNICFTISDEIQNVRVRVSSLMADNMSEKKTNSMCAIVSCCERTKANTSYIKCVIPPLKTDK